MKILIMLVSFLSISQAQIKIGDITVSDSLAKEYFLWCYQHPDTTWFYRNMESKSLNKKKEDELSIKLKEAKNYLDSLTTRFDSMEYTPITISEKESSLLEHNIGEVERKVRINDDLTKYYQGYLTKREPTAQGFSEWYIKYK